jgi:hypothetical protein
MGAANLALALARCFFFGLPLSSNSAVQFSFGI